MKIIELPIIPERPEDYDDIMRRLQELWLREIYIPIAAEMALPRDKLQNSLDELSAAIGSGRIRFYRGIFSGKFSSVISRELRKLGAVKVKEGFKLPSAKIPTSLRSAIAISESRMERVCAAIDQKLQAVVPDQLADKLKVDDLFEKTLWKVNKSFEKSIKNITVAPQLTEHTRERISEEYTQNMKLYIKNWTEQEIIKLREEVRKSAFSGNRWEYLSKRIQKSYGSSQAKAKFLARQETSILMSKFKQMRYQDAGVNGYKWVTVIGSPEHPVRPLHKHLGERSKRGEIFQFDDPPVAGNNGEKQNPGEPYGCRCTARPVVIIR